MIRGKFVLTEVTEHYWTQGKTVKFEARYDETIPEDQKYCEATPTAMITMLITNENALKVLEKGKAYYFDITPVMDA